MKVIPKSSFSRIKKTQRTLENFALWLRRVCLRRGILLDPQICAKGNTQLISEVRKVGGEVIFKSSRCSGCLLGLQAQGAMPKKTSKSNVSQNKVNCGLLNHSWFWANKSLLEANNLKSNKDIVAGKEIILIVQGTKNPFEDVIERIDDKVSSPMFAQIKSILGL